MNKELFEQASSIVIDRAKKHVVDNFPHETDVEQLNCYKHIETFIEGYNYGKEQQLNKPLAFCRLFVEMCEGGMPHDRDLKNQAIEVIKNSNLS
jgi:hypothetical protein